MHPFAIDADGFLYIDVASATNSCQLKNRTLRSPGADPCNELKTRGGVWRIVGRVEILNVATETVRRSSLETAADVTRRALQLRVRAGQYEARSGVVEFDAEPGVHVVACLADNGEAGGPMVDGLG